MNLNWVGRQTRKELEWDESTLTSVRELISWNCNTKLIIMTVVSLFSGWIWVIFNLSSYIAYHTPRIVTVHHTRIPFHDPFKIVAYWWQDWKRHQDIVTSHTNTLACHICTCHSIKKMIQSSLHMHLLVIRTKIPKFFWVKLFIFRKLTNWAHAIYFLKHGRLQTNG